MHARHDRHCLDRAVGSDIEYLRRPVSEDEEQAVWQQVKKRVHLVRHVVDQDVHWDVATIADAIAVEYLVCGIVVAGVEHVQPI